jgi:predicted transcriptional regulator
LIIRDPTALGLRAGMDSIPYSQINKVHLQKGAFTSEIVVDVGRFERDNRKKIKAIPKKKASEILAIINEYIRQSQDVNNTPKNIIQKLDDDPLKILKVRFAKGEITREEYDEMKSALE